MRKVFLYMTLLAFAVSCVLGATTALAAVGDRLAIVNVPVVSPRGIGVGGTFDGTNYIYPNLDTSTASTLHIMTPPSGDGDGTLVSSKPIKDGSGNDLYISAVTWDPSRGKLWGATGNKSPHEIYLIDISGVNAVGTLKFTHSNPDVSEWNLVDGIAYDPSDDTLYLTPDVNCDIYQYDLDPIGDLLNVVTPVNDIGVEDCRVSGVAIGADNTLYVGRDGDAEIRRVTKDTGAFVSNFATTSGRVEDLACDPVTYAPLEAILAKDAYNDLYEAFEVETGTCPLVGEEELTCTKGFWKNHENLWAHIPDPRGFPTWGGGNSYMEILWMSPKRGDASVILAHAFIAATLNTGAPTASLADAMVLLSLNPIGSGNLQAMGKRTDPDRGAALDVADILQAFNESLECTLP